MSDMEFENYCEEVTFNNAVAYCPNNILISGEFEASVSCRLSITPSGQVVWNFNQLLGTNEAIYKTKIGLLLVNALLLNLEVDRTKHTLKLYVDFHILLEDVKGQNEILKMFEEIFTEPTATNLVEAALCMVKRTEVIHD